MLIRAAMILLTLLLAQAGGGIAWSQTELNADELAARADRVMEELAALRGLTLSAPIGVGFVSTEEFRAYVVAKVDAAFGAETFAMWGQAYSLLGLLPGGQQMDLRQATIDSAVGGIVAFYEPQARSFFVVRENWQAMAGADPRAALDVLDAIAAHELVHALQDNHDGLRRLMQPVPGPASDATLARQAVFEGEATLIAMLWRRQRAAGGGAVNLSQTALSDAVRAENFGVRFLGGFRSARPSGADTTLTAYLDGAAFVDRARRHGGWEAVDRLFAKPPVSSEQILHPDRFLVGRPDRPVRFVVPGLRDLQDLGYAITGSDDLGEALVHNLLAGQGQSELVAQRAAHGWDGDRFWLLHDPGGRREHTLVWVSYWDRELDAQQFAEAYELRDSLIERRGRLVVVVAGDRPELRVALMDKLKRVRAIKPLCDRGARRLAQELAAEELELATLPERHLPRLLSYDGRVALPELGLSLRLPTGWTRDDSGLDNYRRLEAWQDDGLGGLLVVTMPAVEGGLEALVAQAQAELEATLNEPLEPQMRRIITLGSQEAVELRFTGAVGDVLVQVLLRRGERVIGITMSAGPSSMPGLAQVFEEILASLRFEAP